jgi:lycopene cyclase-like protein
MSETRDIGVLGSGPAALAIAAACARRGASVTLIAPSPRQPWRPNYCLWADELPAALESLVERSWPEVAVATSLGERQLPRRYAKLHTEAFQRWLWQDLRGSSTRVVAERAAKLEHEDDSTLVRIHGGATERVRLLIDASGAASPFVQRVHRRPPAHQIAYGLFVHAPGHCFDLDRAMLMDFRPAGAAADEPPSFLYLLPLSEDRLFLEETSLASRPGASMAMLRTRLEKRLVAFGLDRSPRIGEERCSIPMGLGLPAQGQPLVAFGAAASMVHPATGYSIAHTLRKAEPVAEVIVGALAEGDVEQARAAGNAAVWSRSQRSTWELYAFGLEALVSMDVGETARFFDAFFRMPLASWAGYLAGTLSPSELGAVMTRLFRSLPASVRWRLVKAGVSAGAAPLARTVLPQGMT